MLGREGWGPGAWPFTSPDLNPIELSGTGSDAPVDQSLERRRNLVRALREESERLNTYA